MHNGLCSGADVSHGPSVQTPLRSHVNHDGGEGSKYLDGTYMCAKIVTLLD